MNNTTIRKIDDDKTVVLEQTVAATQIKVWGAWTTAEEFEKWYAPHSMSVKVSRLDFSDGGHMLYQMLGPDGSGRFWIKSVYSEIDEPRSFCYTDYPSNEQGDELDMMPPMRIKVEFHEVDPGTKITLSAFFHSAQQLEQALNMGAFEGYKQAIEKLTKELTK